MFNALILNATPLKVIKFKPTFPDNIDYNRYIEDTKIILYEIGYLKRIEQQRFF